MRLQHFLAAIALVTVATAGCLGGPSRSGWAYDVTGLDAAYGDGARGKGIVVAVVDTGVNRGHPSLGHLRDGDEGNGEIIAFRDFLGNKQGPREAFDDDGHGTHIVGIMSARGSGFGDKLLNGGIDLRGGSPHVLLVVARVCDAERCEPSVLDDAIDWAVEAHDADIVSLSLGGERAENIFDPVFQTDPVDAAINDAIDQGVVVLASAGNQGSEADDVAYPASIPGVIAVGAINDDRRVASFSNAGDSSANQCDRNTLFSQGRCPPHQKPEVVAPGVGIISTWTGDNYVRADGTSQATPFVTSAVALMLEGQPKLRDREAVVQVKQVLADTAQPLAGQEQPHDDRAGYGLVQADDAVQAYAG